MTFGWADVSRAWSGVAHGLTGDIEGGTELLGLIFGSLLIVLGVCLIGDFGRAAGRLHAFFADLMSPGRATVGTFRLVGIFAVLVGVGWGATSFPLGSMLGSMLG
ncbi:hypothetical protein F9278_25930 [Streptomyces phaeolivaceus]|uniref:Uncharacterized protein n=1 Tax=Streptomyces phaeolivaceus TaxID=2653200 RepID=A0A5P8K906_9ACTN|nr:MULTISPECIES: hypothetical protein [Streptomyces]MDX3065831.1 hypothetical protein [Streptomyces sp. ND04-05B]QFQ99019.1 hypothetical protein F9278_25930 [Streptomyces phaeolivaceus]